MSMPNNRITSIKEMMIDVPGSFPVRFRESHQRMTGKRGSNGGYFSCQRRLQGGGDKKDFRKLSLQEAITQQYSQTAPRTFSRIRFPIDGTSLSPTLCITQGGYLPLGTISSDHVPLWVDIGY